jgi:DNA-binding CsgD family transcriptional regulator
MVSRFSLSGGQLRALTALKAAPTTAPRLAQRIQIVLLAAHGRSVAEIAHALAMSPLTVRTWLLRYHRLGVAGLADLACPGALVESSATSTPERPTPWPRCRSARSRRCAA